MKFTLICYLATGLLAACWVDESYAVTRICWDTGCQKNSWAVKGCHQYGMIEIAQQSCADGIVYSCCEPLGTSSLSPRPKCWDTGCQLDSWAIRGCEQYGMVQTGQHNCENGLIFSCCESNITDSGSNSSSSSSSTHLSSPVVKPKCWDTGCQLDVWAIKGCEQYGMVQTGQKSCENGLIYSCCESNITASDSNGTQVLPPVVKPKCWDTGCQLDSWAIRGCEQYGMVQTGQKSCPNGLIYSCCESNITDSGSSSSNSSISTRSGTSSSTQQVLSPIVKPKCWDTGCQLDGWAIRGCEQYGMVEVGQKSCANGIVYSCCEKNVTTSASLVRISMPKCWDTGCQLDGWAVRGCEQYGMVETGQKHCERGIVYSCCEKNATSTIPAGSEAGAADASAPTVLSRTGIQSVEIVTPTANLSNDIVPPAAPKCWDTGCQLDSWAARGCDQYNMVETGQRPCHDGIIYSCCQKNESTAAAAAAAVVSIVKPKCWDTGCQLDAWAVRGCEQYGMVETGQKSCADGIIYSCCEENGTTTSAGGGSKKLKPKCWDTGCQADSWAVRGCEQYDMVEVGQKSCPDGIVYSCCDKNITTAAPPTKLEPKCWDTGCQLEWWAIRGCDQYDMVEVGQKTCENGIVYSCCHKNGTVPVTRPPPKKCWETGCQLDVWTSRGCEQYSMIEKDQRPCLNGIVFTCCRP